jgi:hypothetical protein
MQPPLGIMNGYHTGFKLPRMHMAKALGDGQSGHQGLLAETVMSLIGLDRRLAGASCVSC